jgi:hypothetical protein
MLCDQSIFHWINKLIYLVDQKGRVARSPTRVLERVTRVRSPLSAYGVTLSFLLHWQKDNSVTRPEVPIERQNYSSALHGCSSDLLLVGAGKTRVDSPILRMGKCNGVSTVLTSPADPGLLVNKSSYWTFSKSWTADCGQRTKWTSFGERV